MEQNPVDEMLISVTVDPDTWLPCVVMAVPITPEDIVNGYASLILAPEDGWRIGQALINSAGVAASYAAELENKTIEERQEILTLEQSLLGPVDPPTS